MVARPRSRRYLHPKGSGIGDSIFDGMPHQLLGLKAFNSHKATYHIHRRDEGNPTGSVHLVKSLSAPRQPLNDIKGVARACGTTLEVGHYTY